MLLETGVLFAAMLVQTNKSMKIDEEAKRKNCKAFTKISDAQYKLEMCQENLFSKLSINAKRKNGILLCHLKMFQKQYDCIKKINFQKGAGIEEIEKIEEIRNTVNRYVAIPAVASGKIMTDSQLLASIALRGIGGVMIKESEMNSKLASRNLSQANAASAQIDSICIALEGISKHVDICTELLEKLGMIYMKSIKNITEILSKNGQNVEVYTEQDLEAINICFKLTVTVYRILNTPLIDKNGEIEKESVKVIEEGYKKLESIQM